MENKKEKKLLNEKALRKRKIPFPDLEAFDKLTKDPGYPKMRWQEMLDVPVNIINWLPTVEKLGIRHPETKLVELSYELVGDFMDGKVTPEVKRIVDEVSKAATEIAETYGWPVFIKTSSISGKHSWEDTCCLPHAGLTLARVMMVMQSHGMAMGAEMPTHIVVRQMIKTSPAFHAFHGKMPITKERRYFINNGKVICHHAYWPTEAISSARTDVWDNSGKVLPAHKWMPLLAKMNDYNREEILLLSCLSEEISEELPGWWSVDWLQSSSGNWNLIDMAPGGMSYHWPTCSKKDGRGE